jgi:beta-lactam-binding protein with PASTA domain
LSVIQTELESLLASQHADTDAGGGTTTTTTVTVPRVIGMSVAAADAAIKAVGLVPGAHSDQVGTVNGQTPAGGAKVAKGSTVDLSVAGTGGGSRGGTVTVPNVIGLQTSVAVARIKAAGLTPGSHANQPGKVNGQTPKGGVKAAKGSKVDLSVAAGGDR